jgi:hypothetical protein
VRQAGRGNAVAAYIVIIVYASAEHMADRIAAHAMSDDQ